MLLNKNVSFTKEFRIPTRKSIKFFPNHSGLNVIKRANVYFKNLSNRIFSHYSTSLKVYK